jgi:hypothetical protein
MRASEEAQRMKSIRADANAKKRNIAQSSTVSDRVERRGSRDRQAQYDREQAPELHLRGRKEENTLSAHNSHKCWMCSERSASLSEVEISTYASDARPTRAAIDRVMGCEGK